MNRLLNCQSRPGRKLELCKLNRLLLTHAKDEPWAARVLSEIDLDFSLENIGQAQRLLLDDFEASLKSRYPLVRHRYTRPIRQLSQTYCDAVRAVTDKQIRILNPYLPLSKQPRARSIVKLKAVFDLLGLEEESSRLQYLTYVIQTQPNPTGLPALNQIASPVGVLSYMIQYKEYWSKIEQDFETSAVYRDYYSGLALEALGLLEDSIHQSQSRFEAVIPTMLSNLPSSNLFAHSHHMVRSLRHAGLLAEAKPDLVASLSTLTAESKKDRRLRQAITRVHHTAKSMLVDLQPYGSNDIDGLMWMFGHEDSLRTRALSWYERRRDLGY